jgi:hypothetical protein
MLPTGNATHWLLDISGFSYLSSSTALETSAPAAVFLSSHYSFIETLKM